MSKESKTLDMISPQEFGEVKTQTIHMPSGFTVDIRETNGQDEDIISNVGDSKAGIAIAKFLAQIVVSCSKGKPTYNDIMKWFSRDKNYLMLKSRMFSIGNEITFEHQFEKSGMTFTFKEDLAIYDFDFSTGGAPPKKGENNFDDKLPQAYKSDDSTYQTQLSSGKTIRFKYLTGLDEKKLLAKQEEDLSINEKLRLRDLELQIDGNWYIIENFHPFTSKDMKDLRNILDKEDPEFGLIAELVNPKRPSEKEIVSLFDKSDFFFPRD
jgi:hypothetical protein